jgi:hypothetical protein
LLSLSKRCAIDTRAGGLAAVLRCLDVRTAGAFPDHVTLAPSSQGEEVRVKLDIEVSTVEKGKQVKAKKSLGYNA